MDQAYPIVCHVTSVHPVPDPRIFLKQCHSLSEAGFTVYALFAGDRQGFEWGKIRPVPVGPRTEGRLRRLLLQPVIARTLLRLRPQIIHFHDPELLPLMCLLQKLALPQCRFIYDVHEDYQTLVSSYGFPWSATIGFYNLLAAYAEKHMTLILAEDSYQSRFRRLHPVIHNFSLLPPSSENLPRENTFIYVGSVCENRGASMMVKTFARLQVPDWKLQIIGRPSPTQIGPQLKELAGREAIHPRLIEIHDYMPLTEAMGKVRRAKAGLCLLSPEPNHIESLPTKVFDYLSVGVPVVLSNFPYYQTFFAGVPGIHFVDAQNVDAVEGKLREFIDPAVAERYLAEAAVGQKHCLERFTWSNEAIRLVTLYRALISPSPCSPAVL